jgi:hypothetical protein
MMGVAVVACTLHYCRHLWRYLSARLDRARRIDGGIRVVKLDELYEP